LTPNLRDELAQALGVPACVIELLGVGWSARDRAWTFPERDGAGNVVAILRRYRDSDKPKVMAGGERGLFIPQGLPECDGPLLLPEGASNVLALFAMGLPAVGRPNNIAGTEHLARLLADLYADREIIVLADFDPKEDGSWPGKEGAMSVGGGLAEALRRLVSWALPPGKAKDALAWLQAQNQDLTCTDHLPIMGADFLASLKKNTIQAEKVVDSEPVLVTCDPELESMPVEYLVPNFLARRMLTVLYGARDCNKSTLAQHHAVTLSKAKQHVLLLSAEENWQETLLPKLRGSARCAAPRRNLG
jgi:hypothetical protein